MSISLNVGAPMRVNFKGTTPQETSSQQTTKKAEIGDIALKAGVGSLALLGVLGAADVVLCKGKHINKLTGQNGKLDEALSRATNAESKLTAAEAKATNAETKLAEVEEKLNTVKAESDENKGIISTLQEALGLPPNLFKEEREKIIIDVPKLSLYNDKHLMLFFFIFYNMSKEVQNPIGKRIKNILNDYSIEIQEKGLMQNFGVVSLPNIKTPSVAGAAFVSTLPSKIRPKVKYPGKVFVPESWGVKNGDDIRLMENGNTVIRKNVDGQTVLQAYDKEGNLIKEKIKK